MNKQLVTKKLPIHYLVNKAVFTVYYWLFFGTPGFDSYADVKHAVMNVADTAKIKISFIMHGLLINNKRCVWLCI